MGKARVWLGALLIILLVAGWVPGVVQGSTPADVTGHWAEDAITQAVAAGYVSGYPDSTFRPDTPLTRAEAIKLVQAALGTKRYGGTDGAGILSDVGPSHWLIAEGYGDPAVLNVVAGLWSASPGDVPRAGQRITRGEFAALVARLHEAEFAPDAIVESRAASIPDLTSWPHPGKLWALLAVARGMLNGFPDGTFRPDETLTRAQAVTILERVRSTPPGRPRLVGEGVSAVTAWDSAYHVRRPDGRVVQRGRVVDMPPVVAVAEGENHTLALGQDGTVWAWGANEIGQLGDRSLQFRGRPVQVYLLENVVAIAAGSGYSLALRADGTVWAWGRGMGGQLGTGEQGNAWGPVPTLELTDAVAIAAGSNYSLALRTDGTVYEWGATGRDGGQNSTIIKSSPVRKADLNRVTAIAVGDDVALALREDGSVWAWSPYHLLVLEGSAGDWPVAPTRVDGLSEVTAIAAGDHFGLALKTDGTAWSWGLNSMGELGDGSVLDAYRPVQVKGLRDIRAISAGWHSGLAITAGGSIFGWGTAMFLPAFDPAKAAKLPALPGVTALAAGGEQAVALTDSGQLYAWGEWRSGALGTHFRTTISPVVDVPPSVMVAAGDHYTLSLTRDGGVWMWGLAENEPEPSMSGGKSQVPLLSHVTYIAAGTEHALAVDAAGSVWTWGRNGRGQLGAVTPKDNMTPVRVPPLTGMQAVAGGHCHSLALASNGAVWAWGCNDDGQLGDSASPERRTPVKVAGLPPVKAIAASGALSLALDAAGSLWAWGARVGERPVQLRGIPGVLRFGASADGAWAQGDDGTVWAWGVADTASLLSPAGAAAHQLQEWKGATAVAVSGNRMVALLPDGTLETRGSEPAYNLGLVHAAPLPLGNVND